MELHKTKNRKSIRIISVGGFFILSIIKSYTSCSDICGTIKVLLYLAHPHFSEHDS